MPGSSDPRQDHHVGPSQEVERLEVRDPRRVLTDTVGDAELGGQWLDRLPALPLRRVVGPDEPQAHGVPEVGPRGESVGEGAEEASDGPRHVVTAPPGVGYVHLSVVGVEETGRGGRAGRAPRRRPRRPRTGSPCTSRGGSTGTGPGARRSTTATRRSRRRSRVGLVARVRRRAGTRTRTSGAARPSGARGSGRSGHGSWTSTTNGTPHRRFQYGPRTTTGNAVVEKYHRGRPPRPRAAGRRPGGTATATGGAKRSPARPSA